MNAYVLVIMTWLAQNQNWVISQQEYADMDSCVNAANIITGMTKPDKSKVQWACVPKKN